MARLGVPVETISRVLDRPGEPALSVRTYALHSFIEDTRVALQKRGDPVAMLHQQAATSEGSSTAS